MLLNTRKKYGTGSKQSTYKIEQILKCTYTQHPETFCVLPNVVKMLLLKLIDVEIFLSSMQISYVITSKFKNYYGLHNCSRHAVFSIFNMHCPPGEISLREIVKLKGLSREI
jgi:hypothetical protein